MSSPSSVQILSEFIQGLPDAYSHVLEYEFESGEIADAVITGADDNWTLVVEAKAGVTPSDGVRGLFKEFAHLLPRHDFPDEIYGALLTDQGITVYQLTPGDQSDEPYGFLELIGELDCDPITCAAHVINLIETYRTPRVAQDASKLHKLLREYRRELEVDFEANLNHEAILAGVDQEEDLSEDDRGRIILKAATSLINRVALGAVLETLPEYGAIPALNEAEKPEKVVSALEHIWSEVLFVSPPKNDPYLELLKEYPAAVDILQAFKSDLDEIPLWQLSGETLVEVFSRFSPEAQRKALGNYYTDEWLCDGLTTYGIVSGNETILDPACGTGGILVQAAEQLAPVDSNTLVENLQGIDNEPFAAELAATQLVLKHLDRSTKGTNITLVDFEEVHPREGRGDAAEKSPRSSRPLKMWQVDAILSHPPNTPSESYDWRSWAETVEEAYEDLDPSGRWNLAAYFVVHASQFVREDGRAGFVLPSGWLSRVSYGEFRRFLLSHYDIDAIVDLEQPLYGGGGTLLLMRHDESRVQTDVLFATVSGSDDLEKVVQAIDTSHRSIAEESVIERLRSQSTLDHEESWAQYIEAPSAYFTWKDHSDCVLSEFTTVQTGLITGANEFFLNPNGEESRLANHTAEILTTKTPLDSYQTSGVELDQVLFPAHEIRDELRNQPKERVEEILRGHGEDTLLDYLREGLDRGINERQTLQARDQWFILPEPEVDDFYIPRLFSRGHPILVNDGDVRATGRFIGISISDSLKAETLHEPEGVDLDETDLRGAIAGILNSTPVKVAMVLSGSKLRGGYVELSVNMLERLPIPDLKRLDGHDLQTLDQAFQNLVLNNEESQKVLDRTLLRAFDIDIDDQSLRDFLKQYLEN